MILSYEALLTYLHVRNRPYRTENCRWTFCETVVKLFLHCLDNEVVYMLMNNQLTLLPFPDTLRHWSLSRPDSAQCRHPSWSSSPPFIHPDAAVCMRSAMRPNAFMVDNLARGFRCRSSRYLRVGGRAGLSCRPPTVPVAAALRPATAEAGSRSPPVSRATDGGRSRGPFHSPAALGENCLASACSFWFISTVGRSVGRLGETSANAISPPASDRPTDRPTGRRDRVAGGRVGDRSR